MALGDQPPRGLVAEPLLAPVIKVLVMRSRVDATAGDTRGLSVPPLRAWTPTISPAACGPGATALSPAEAGLPASSRRRAPGLRREEVAQLAGLSVDYLARLEQGRASAPSPCVLAPLARALRLTDDERAHLFRVAGQVPPGAGQIDRHITPSVQRVLDRLGRCAGDRRRRRVAVIAKNALAIALLGESNEHILRRHFSGEPSRVLRTPEEVARMEEGGSATCTTPPAATRTTSRCRR